MPEISEIARIVYFLRKNLVGKTLKVVKAQEDANVYGKVGTSAEAFEKALRGKKVMSAGQQGKYFWLLMDSPPHPVMHFGMTGWLPIRGEPVAKYAPRDDDDEVWPPKYWKFLVETEEQPKVEAAFTDPRRFARIRLVDCAAEDIRKTTPLKENGPDPVIDRDILTLEWFEQKMNSKHVPVKALLLDQANISGIGNWVGDEILYHAKLHPEQYSNTFSSEQLKRLHTSMLHICQTAVDLLADASKFPDDWLFKHRWGKGKKDAPTTLPNGAKITFLTVGGRTSCVVPSVQKKTGAVAGDVKPLEDGIDLEEEGEKQLSKTKKRKAPEIIKREEDPVLVKEVKAPKAQVRRVRKIKSEDDAHRYEPKTKKRKSEATPSTHATVPEASPKIESKEGEVLPTSRRRSNRISKG